MEDIRIVPEGDSAILVEFPQVISYEINNRIISLVELLKEQYIEGVMDMTPAFCSLLVHYDPRVVTYKKLVGRIEKMLTLNFESRTKVRKVYEIPVCYGGEYGPDLDFVAKNAGISVDEVIKIHTSEDYLIYMLGFLPGFPYLGGLNEKIHTPRLANPRIKIPAGSVGIGGVQTGIYPLESPGGWQLIGQTPVKTYDPERSSPILFEAGNYIRFRAVSEEEFEKIKSEVENNTYEQIIHMEEV